MQLTRRTALMGALGLGTAAFASPLAAAAGHRLRGGYPWPLGVQLWSVNAELERDFAGTLAAIAKLGYQRVEAAGWHGRSAAEFRQAVTAAGLVCDSAHLSMPDLLVDTEAKIAFARELGVTYLVCSSPKPDRPLEQGVDWIPAITHAMTLAAWHENAADLNRIGAMAAKAGLKLGYHNHPAEFTRYDGQRGFDVLMRETDPKLVTFELDVAWAAAGGADPVTVIDNHRGRIALLHLKDIAATMTPGRMLTDFTTVEIGRGTINWPAVIAAAERAGVRGAYVEQEAPYVRPMLQSLAITRDYLRSL